MKKLVDLGYLEVDNTSLEGKTYCSLTKELVGSKALDKRELVTDVAAFLNLRVEDPILQRFEWLGLFDNIAISSKVLESVCAKERQVPTVILFHRSILGWMHCAS